MLNICAINRCKRSILSVKRSVVVNLVYHIVFIIYTSISLFFYYFSGKISRAFFKNTAPLHHFTILFNYIYILLWVQWWCSGGAVGCSGGALIGHVLTTAPHIISLIILINIQIGAVVQC